MEKKIIGHIRDVELKLLFSRFVHLIQIAEKNNPLINSAQRITWLKDSINDYCRKENIVYEDSIHIFVKPEPEIDYAYFLAMLLVVSPTFEIELYLDHHLKKWTGEPSGFFDIVANTTLQFVNTNSQFQGDEHDLKLELIVSWIKDNKKNINLLTSKIVQQKTTKDKKELSEIKLSWLGEDKVLKDISNRVQQSGYTFNQLDFYNVFKKGKPTKWRKETEYLIYLIHKLYTNKPQQFKASFGKSHISTAISFFGEDSQKLANKNSIHSLINDITQRRPENYTSTTSKVDTMLKQVLPN